jgi:hypothetical protein
VQDDVGVGVFVGCGSGIVTIRIVAVDAPDEPREHEQPIVRMAASPGQSFPLMIGPI